MALSRHQITGTFVRPIPEQASALNRVLTSHQPVDVFYADATFAGVIPLLGRPAGTPASSVSLPCPWRRAVSMSPRTTVDYP